MIWEFVHIGSSFQVWVYDLYGSLLFLAMCLKTDINEDHLKIIRVVSLLGLREERNRHFGRERRWSWGNTKHWKIERSLRSTEV